MFNGIAQLPRVRNGTAAAAASANRRRRLVPPTALKAQHIPRTGALVRAHVRGSRARRVPGPRRHSLRTLARHGGHICRIIRAGRISPWRQLVRADIIDRQLTTSWDHFMRALLVVAVALSASTFAPPAPLAQATTSAAPAALEAGDVLEVTIWREDDLSGEFLVDETGSVTLPLLGRHEVTGKALAAVRDELIEGYRRHLNNPSITILPLRRVYVLGEVNKPGLYKLDPTVTLAGAVAMAEGATENGELSRIRVIRDGEAVQARPQPGQKLDDIDIRSGDQIFVEEKGWLRRNNGFLLNSLVSLATSVLTTYLVVQITR